MPGPDVAAILDACRLFAGLDPARRAALAGIAAPRSYGRGAVLFREGDPVPGIIVIGTGQARVYKISPAGKEHVLHLAGPGTTIAEVAVIEGIPCPASAEALEDLGCALIDAGGFRALLDDDPVLARELLAGLAAWVRRFVDLLEDIVLRDAAGRLASHLLGRPEVDGVATLPQGRRQLALHLNLTPETLSRVLRRFQDEGLVAAAGPDLRLLDRRGLRAVAGGWYPRA